MHSVFKKAILLWLVLFSTFLFADATKVQVFSDGPVRESAGSTSFTIKLTDGVDFCDELKVNYTTVDGSATEPADYTKKSGFVTFYGTCLFPPHFASSDSQTVSVDIIDDSDYEVNQAFWLKLTSVTAGYQIDADHNVALANIQDNDTQPLILNNFDNKSITEGDIDITLYMTVKFNRKTTEAMTLTYHTEDGSAQAGTDYSSVTNTINIAIDSNRALLPIVIKGNLTPEETKNFKVIIDSISKGIIQSGEDQATATIYDDDAISFNITSNDVFEGNPGDNNKMRFRIFLSNEKILPIGTADIKIHYVTVDGSSSDPAELSDSDYTKKEGDITFRVGDLEYFIDVSITPDTKVEPDETLQMTISRDGTDLKTSESEILRDDGYPGIDFSAETTPTDYKVVEGNTSTRELIFHFTLDKPAVAGTSFKYHTENYTAKTEDNDYVETNGTYFIPVNTKDINISVTVKGDRNIEKDEVFKLVITDEQKLYVVGHIAKGHIINDDGTYPELNFDLNTYTINEGDAGVKDINFTLSFNKPALAGSSFKYHTEEINATKNIDYNHIDSTLYPLVGGEKNITLSVTVKGDIVIEEDDFFKLVIDNYHKIDSPPSDRASALGKIVNDDSPHIIDNIGEFRFDDCGAEEWKIDNSPIGNDALDSSPQIITNNDGKTYMCGSLNAFSSNVKIPHHLAYEVDEGSFSMLLYDNHNIWSENSWLFKKGNLKVEVVRVEGNRNKGSIKVYLDGHTIDTREVFFTNSDGGDLDTQWIHVTVTFGSKGMKLFINGIKKGTNPYTGGIKNIHDELTMATLSGYFDELYIFKGQMNDTEVQQLYSNIINDINIDGTPRDCGCHVATDEFTCNSTMYISSSTNRETSDTGRMWLHRIDTANNPFDFKVVESTGASDLYNATAYNPDDNFIYGLFHRELIKITRGGLISSLGVISELPIRFDNNQLYAGAISNNYYYVAGRNSPKLEIYKINIDSSSPNYKKVTTINLTKAVALQDFSFYKNISNPSIPEGTYLYGIDRNNKLTKIDVRDGTVTQVGPNHIGYEFDSSFSDQNGRFFANDSLGHGFFEFDLRTGIKSFISNSQSATFNDGANCINSSLVFSDYSDAPSTYHSAKHKITNGIFMGTEVDHDIHAYFSEDADGDDNNGIDDDDGVTLLDGTDLNNSYFPLNQTHELKIKVSKDGFLNLWIDFDADGHFNARDKIITAGALTAGEHTLSFTVPSTANTINKSYMRFRFSSTANLTYREDANDGEVEDYMVHFGSAFTPLKGIFNIERTNSELNPNINSDERNAWYTQITGRDFNYAVLFYEENLSNVQIAERVTFKVELYNNEDHTTVSEMTPYYGYFSSIVPTHKKLITASSDLEQLPALKDVSFRISYAINPDDSVVQADCSSGDYEQCYNTLASTYTIKEQPANDNFSIRPSHFYVKMKDRNRLLKENTTSTVTPIRLASGYDYNLSIKAMHEDNITIENQYTSSDVNLSVLFQDDTINCFNQSDYSYIKTLTNGEALTTFSNAEVGKYLLHLEDKTWTKVDWENNKTDCNISRSDISVSGDIPSGCKIVSNHDVNLSFYPYQFDLNTIGFNVLPIDEFDTIYMSEVNRTFNNVAVQLQGDIIAQNMQGTRTENFTYQCAAEEISIWIDVNITSDTGLNQPIQTTTNKDGNRGAVFFNRLRSINNLPFNTNRHIPDIRTPIVIRQANFLDNNRTRAGIVNIDVRYNVDKNISQPINPISVNFQAIHANSRDARSNAEEDNSFVPRGDATLNSLRYFYFTRVKPHSYVYPRVIYSGHNVAINTPLSVEIFCDFSDAYCRDMQVFNNTNIYACPNRQKGWYVAINHNQNLDGNITSLNSLSDGLRVVPNNNQTFSNGQNSVVLSTVINANHSINRVDVMVPPPLKYDPDASRNGNPPFAVPQANTPPSEWTGIGKVGYIIGTEANTDDAKKASW